MTMVSRQNQSGAHIFALYYMEAVFMDVYNGCAGDQDRIFWHPAFVEAMMLELEDWKYLLDFVPEYQLNAAPLVVDMLVIKKNAEAVIDKNIARIFRGHNIIEYKSPEARVSVWDFYKVYSYVCIYAVLNKTDFGDISVTFAVNSRPKKLFRYLKDVRGFGVDEAASGIYHVTGDKLGLAIQFICREELSWEDNLWLKGLGSDLDADRCGRLLAEAKKRGTLPGAYMDVALKANFRIMEDAMVLATDTELREMFLRLKGVQKWLSEIETRARAEADSRAKAESEARARAERENERLRQEIAALRQSMEAKG
jgi:hypothetical protein